ncbi:MAG: hypothetical protein Q9210_003418 [Variospora velana]
MANNEQPYDPYIPSGRGTPGPNAQHGDNDRTAALQAQIDDTVNVMRQNIQRTEQRQGNLDHLEVQSGRVNESAQQFQRGTNKVMKKLRWKNVRMWGWVILGSAIVIIIIALGSRTQIVRNLL